MVRAEAVALDDAAMSSAKFGSRSCTGEMLIAILRPGQRRAVRAGLVDDEAADVVDEPGLLGDRDEERRRDGAELLRGPARPAPRAPTMVRSLARTTGW